MQASEDSESAPDEASPARVRAAGAPRHAVPAHTRAGERSFVGRHRGDLIGLAWILVFVLLYLSPVLKDGPTFGPADLGRGLSVLTSLGAAAPPNHNVINGDLVTQSIAWNTLDWRLVHHGELPLWNDLSGNGLPQFLNFESAAFALPTLVGYLFPLSVAFLVTIAMKLLIAGTGAYVLARLLRARPSAAAFAGTTFMLSGSLTGWLGWSVSGPLVWVGWTAAAAVLAYRAAPRQRAGPLALLAVSVAFAIYGGFPESYVLLVLVLGALLGVTGVGLLVSKRRISLVGAGFVGAGLLGGVALSAPLWMPGLSVLRASVRAGRTAATGLPLHSVLQLVTQGYYGLPLGSAVAKQGTYFGPVNYFETTAYVGVLALVLAAVCVLTAWRRPVVVGLGLAAAGCALFVYQLGSGAPVQRLVRAVGLGSVAVPRMLPMLGFCLALLAGLGLETVLQRWRDPVVQAALGLATAGLAALLAVMWLKVPGARFLPPIAPGVPEPSVSASSVRASSLWWPSAEVALLGLLAGALPLVARSPRTWRASVARVRRAFALGAGALLAAQSAFLLFAGVGINSYAPVSYPVTPATATLTGIVGTGLVGLDGVNTDCGSTPTPPCGLRQWEGIGFYPVINIGYSMAELATHDPLVPKAYFDAFPVPNNDQDGGGTNLFAPSIDTLALAHLYGVQYVIVQPPRPVPVGMRLVTTIVADGVVLKLAAVPGSSRFSFPSRGADHVVATTHPGDATYVVDLVARSAEPLSVRITNVAGWQASADGHPLALVVAPGDLQSVTVPAGTHTVVFTYRPHLLAVGFDLALAALAVLGAFAMFEAITLRRRVYARATAWSDHRPGATTSSGPDGADLGIDRRSAADELAPRHRDAGAGGRSRPRAPDSAPDDVPSD